MLATKFIDDHPEIGCHWSMVSFVNNILGIYVTYIIYIVVLLFVNIDCDSSGTNFCRGVFQ